MKERPILMSAPMVRACLEGSKTQTRRILKPQPTVGEKGLTTWGNIQLSAHSFEHYAPSVMKDFSPYGKAGDRLWVRETHYRYGHWEPVPGVKTKGGRMKWKFVADTSEVLYDPPAEYRKGRHHKDPATKAWHMRLGRFMPRALHRIVLEITGVRVERLQDCSDDDAFAEGVLPSWTGPRSGYSVAHPAPSGAAYADLWDEINGPGSWESNPWVWVVEFKRVKP